MNRRAVYNGLIYCALAIAFKLYILLSGQSFTKFGFNYSIIVSIFLIVPFFFIAIWQVREKERGGVIGGRDAIRIALTVLVVGIVVVSTYNYIEFNWKTRELSVAYYKGPVFLERLKEMQARLPDKIKTEDFPKIIEEQLTSLSAFKATTGKLIPMLIIGLGGSFVAAVMLKRSVPRHGAAAARS